MQHSLFVLKASSSNKASSGFSPTSDLDALVTALTHLSTACEWQEKWLNSESRTYQWDGDDIAKVYDRREFFGWIFAQIDPLVADDDKLKGPRVPFWADDTGVVRSDPLVRVNVQRSLQKSFQAKISLSHLLCRYSRHPFQLYPLPDLIKPSRIR